MVSTYKSLSAGNAGENRGERLTERKGGVRGEKGERDEIRVARQGSCCNYPLPAPRTQMPFEQP